MKAKKFDNWIRKNWSSYVLLRNLGFFLPFPIGLSLILTGFTLLSPVYLVLLSCTLVIALKADTQRLVIAEEKPLEFVKGENIEHGFEILTNLFALTTMGFMVASFGVIMILRYQTQNPTLTLPMPFVYVMLFLIVLFFSSSLAVMFTIIETSILLEVLRNKKLSWKIPRYRVSDRLRARARFVAAEYEMKLSILEKLAIQKRFSLINDGIKIYNQHLKTRFGISLSDPEKFSRCLKLTSLSDETADDFRCCIDSLAEVLKEKEENPFMFVRFLKEIANEQTAKDEIYKEFDVELNPITKWLAKHHEFLTVVLTPLIISTVAVVVGYVLNLL